MPSQRRGLERGDFGDRVGFEVEAEAEIEDEVEVEVEVEA
jgi:hypothetical protein